MTDGPSTWQVAAVEHKDRWPGREAPGQGQLPRGVVPAFWSLRRLG